MMLLEQSLHLSKIASGGEVEGGVFGGRNETGRRTSGGNELGSRPATGWFLKAKYDESSEPFQWCFYGDQQNSRLVINNWGNYQLFVEEM